MKLEGIHIGSSSARLLPNELLVTKVLADAGFLTHKKPNLIRECFTSGQNTPKDMKENSAQEPDFWLQMFERITFPLRTSPIQRSHFHSAHRFGAVPLHCD